ncbi:hypothetical protein TNCV_1617711 [Trichonephila clavipes]|nr:hypothetical protein TNCV_1617711 [Trichonephila clavipes]
MPNEIKLADYKFNIPGKIDVLLGAEIFYELLRPGQIYCEIQDYSYKNTVFGYVVSGSVGDEMTAKMVCRCTDLIEFFFGVNASPFLLAATIKTHIGKYMEKYPDTVRTLDHCFYVDDLVTGEDDAKSAFDLSSKAAKS